MDFTNGDILFMKLRLIACALGSELADRAASICEQWPGLALQPNGLSF